MLEGDHGRLKRILGPEGSLQEPDVRLPDVGRHGDDTVTDDYGLLCAGKTVAFTRSQFEGAVLQWAEETHKHYLSQPDDEFDREFTVDHEQAARAITSHHWADAPVHQDDAQLGVLLEWAIESTATY